MNNNISFKLDNKVVYTMLILATLFLALMAFKYTTKEKCAAVNFSYRTANKNDVVYTSEKVYFSSELKYNAESWEWDFGDKQKHDFTSGPYCTHDYTMPGQYTVRLIINKACEFARTINVNKRADAGKKLVPIPLWPKEPLTTGQNYNFGDETVGAVTWSWYIDNQPKLLQQNITKLFVEPGEHIVTLVLNDDWENNRVERKFNVRPAAVVNSAPIANNAPTARGGGGRVNNDVPQDINTGKPISDKLPGLSMEEIAANANKIATVSDQVLKGYVLAINGNGYNSLIKYSKNNNLNTCTILFNDKNITVDQLKENVTEHAKYGESFDVKQSTNTDNKIIQITITAKLKSKDRLLLKNKKREYPY